MSQDIPGYAGTGREGPDDELFQLPEGCAVPRPVLSCRPLETQADGISIPRAKSQPVQESSSRPGLLSA